MWKSFVLELHGEWSEFADECIALKSTIEVDKSTVQAYRDGIRRS
jgi:hypothetical protein